MHCAFEPEKNASSPHLVYHELARVLLEFNFQTWQPLCLFLTGTNRITMEAGAQSTQCREEKLKVRLSSTK